MKKYNEYSSGKDSILCVGLDPVLSEMRDQYIVPPSLIEEYGIADGVKKFCVDIIRAVAPYTPIIKPNAQFLTYALSFDALKEIVDVIHESDCLALLDCKLTDIGSTNSAGIYWVDRLGFDAVTFSPFPGYENGVDRIYDWSKDRDKGIFALCRMSNPGAHDYQSKALDGEPLYIRLARDAFHHECNGYIVGCTAPWELGEIRSVIGEESLILSPGLGPQGGDPEVALKLGSNSVGGGLIVSSSRSINYAYERIGWDGKRFAEAAGKQAELKRNELNQYREKL